MNTRLISETSARYSNKLKKLKISKKIVLYALLMALGYVYIYPVLYMIVSSLMTMDDLVNPTVTWVPTEFFLGNYRKAVRVLHFGESLFTSVFLAFVSSLLQTLSCSLAGYAFARHNFPGKKFYFALMIGIFLIPSQVMTVPKYLLFDTYKLLNSELALFVPAAFGQGIKSTIFVLIFYQAFRSYPQSFDEAAQLDGAGRLKVFLKIAVPVCLPAFVIAFLFSFVWYWNETYQSSLLLGSEIRTLPMRLNAFVQEYSRLYPTSDGSEINKINESIRMAGTILTIVPLLVLYSVLQKQFVEGIESSGITGE
ncbi:MAG TPA: carbohydrate ABC transporter permease [Clostridiales bacterium]|nr:carbohydrate ABC transporter permease [Clostridiales bacterium]